MTVRLYHADPYCRDFQAMVTEVRGDWLVLDRTAFFPGGGGQVADTGTVSGLPVTEVRKDGQDIMHRVPGHGWSPGDTVHGVIEWPRRYDLMKGHTGEHLLFSQLLRQCPDLELVKISITPEKKSVMVNGPLDWEMVRRAEVKVEEAIESSLPIAERTVAKGDPLLADARVKLERIQEDDVRVIEIGDVDRAACAGVHVHDTAEIGMLLVTALTSARPAAEFEVEFMVGDAAKRRALELSYIALQTAEVMGSRPHDLPSAVRNTLRDGERREMALRRYESMALERLEPSIVGGVRVFSATFDGMDKRALIEAANNIIKERAACVLGSKGDKFMLIVACHPELDVDCVAILNKTLEPMGGRGGGKRHFATGGGPAQRLGDEITRSAYDQMIDIIDRYCPKKETNVQ